MGCGRSAAAAQEPRPQAQSSNGVEIVPGQSAIIRNCPNARLNGERVVCEEYNAGLGEWTVKGDKFPLSVGMSLGAQFLEVTEPAPTLLSNNSCVQGGDKVVLKRSGDPLAEVEENFEDITFKLDSLAQANSCDQSSGLVCNIGTASPTLSPDHILTPDFLAALDQLAADRAEEDRAAHPRNAPRLRTAGRGASGAYAGPLPEPPVGRLPLASIGQKVPFTPRGTPPGTPPHPETRTDSSSARLEKELTQVVDRLKKTRGFPTTPRIPGTPPLAETPTAHTPRDDAELREI